MNKYRWVDHISDFLVRRGSTTELALPSIKTRLHVDKSGASFCGSAQPQYQLPLYEAPQAGFYGSVDIRSVPVQPKG